MITPNNIKYLLNFWHFLRTSAGINFDAIKNQILYWKIYIPINLYQFYVD